MKNEATERLSTLLSEGIDVHRCAAARALGVIGQPQATDSLVKALLDEDADVRIDAATALATIQDPASAAKLMDNLLGDPDADVKKAAITALVAMRYGPVVPVLRALTLSRADDQVVWDEDEFYAEGWDSWVDIQLAAIRGLAEFAPEEAAADIMEAMKDDMDHDIAEPAYQALAQMGESGAKALSELYNGGSARARRRIARAVIRSGNRSLDDLRLAMLDDEAARIRALALEGFAPSDPVLQPLFDDDEAEVRAALLRHAGAENLPALRKLIEDPAPQVRIEVFRIIAANPDDFGDEETVSAVKGAIKGDPEAAKHASLALFALQGPRVAKGLTHVLGNEEIPRDFRLGVLETLEKAGDVSSSALLGVAGDPDRQLRLASLTALANIAANSPDWPNEAGLGLLSALRGELVLPPEPEAEPEEEEEVEEAETATEPDAGAGAGAGEAGADQAELDDIAREIDESLPLVAEDAKPGSTLRSIMANEPDRPEEKPGEIVLDEVQERLLARTNSRSFSKRKVSWQTAVAPYLDVQRFSARLLEQVVKPEVTAALIEALERDIDEETREAVLFSLARHGAETGALPASLRERAEELLHSPVSEIRVLAARILGWLPGDETTERLEQLLSHEDQLVRVEAVRGLDQRNVAGAPLVNVLHDEYLGAGIAAARALARIAGDDAVDALVEFAVRNDGIYRRDIGRLLGMYAPDKGAVRLIELLSDEQHKAQWLVAIDALAEIFRTQDQAPDEALLVA